MERQEKIVNTKKKIEKEERTDKKILIIEDEQDLARILAMRLLKHGYQVISASDGLSGVKRAVNERPDLILLDMIMPTGGGISVFENLRFSKKTMLIPVILMSGLLLPDDLRRKAARLGADDCIAKPFESEELIRKIERILGK